MVDPLAILQMPVTVNINGRSAQVLYAGVAPNLSSGVFQINVRVPTTAVSGPNVIYLVMGHGSTALVTVQIQ